MTTWKSDELDRIGNAEELQIASLRPDGTLRNPVTIWVVRVGEGLYVRAYKGRTSPWFRGALARHEGHIEAGGIEKVVTFVEEGEDGVNEQIDAAYRMKYHRYSAGIIESVVTPGARAATLRLVPC
jgi:hypothetical protein